MGRFNRFSAHPTLLASLLNGFYALVLKIWPILDFSAYVLNRRCGRIPTHFAVLYKGYLKLRGSWFDVNWRECGFNGFFWHVSGLVVCFWGVRQSKPPKFWRYTVDLIR
ncbi:hypothetical protein HY994_01175 [Candidatus Micrarchaeota archaeon]|nr:hypothetical protein [Candidatus Micrarchaeota archaeon]